MNLVGILIINSTCALFLMFSSNHIYYVYIKKIRVFSEENNVLRKSIVDAFIFNDKKKLINKEYSIKDKNFLVFNIKNQVLYQGLGRNKFYTHTILKPNDKLILYTLENVEYISTVVMQIKSDDLMLTYYLPIENYNNIQKTYVINKVKYYIENKKLMRKVDEDRGVAIF